MEEGADTSEGRDGASSTTAVLSPPVEPEDSIAVRSGPAGTGIPDETTPSAKGTDGSRRRFTIAASVGTVVAAVPFLWVLWAPWQSPNLLRSTAYENNFYDLQTRAMLHGHLWLANGSIGIEAFVHAGRQYTYFGLFPSLLRMPILAFTSSLDGKLTAPFILTAWLLTALFTSMLLWRVRILIRGGEGMGRAEATTFGVLMTTILGGSVFLYLAVTPYVFNEDLAWSVALTTGSFFALLGVLERPSWGRVVASGLLMVATNLDRATTGWACVLAALLIAVWFGLGRGGAERHRWWIPVLSAGLVPLLIGCAVNYAKFGVPFGVSNLDQLWTHINAYRRKFLAANHNSEYGTTFIPSTVLAYLRPDGLRITSIFPFVSLPSSPPRALGGVLFDRRYRTASLPSSMPLLFLLSCWGMVTAFRPKPIGQAALTRILLVAGLVAGGALFIWGYIAPRYLADFLPFLILASAVAVVDIYRRLAGRSRSARLGAMGVITLVALFSVVANLGISISPNEEFSTGQVLGYVDTQHAISDVTGHPLNRRVTEGTTLPPWAPADQLYVIGDCDGLYISNGENYSTVPNQQYTRTTWMTVELGHAFRHTFRLTVSPSASTSSEVVPLLATGATTVTARAQAISSSQVAVSFRVKWPNGSSSGVMATERPGTSHAVVVVTDPEKHVIEVSIDGHILVGGPLAQRSPVVVATQSTGTGSLLNVTNITASTPRPTLCERLIAR